MHPANLLLPTGPGRAVANLRSTLLRLPVRDALVAAWLVLATSAVVYADEHLQDWIPDVRAIPDDAEVVTDRAIGSTATSADVDALFADWEESLSNNGYPVTQALKTCRTGRSSFPGQSSPTRRSSWHV